MHIAAIEIPNFQQIPAPAYSLASLSVIEGQFVRSGQHLARLETQDSSQDLTSPQEGYVVGLHTLQGQIVHPGQVLCYICYQPSILPNQPEPHPGSPGLSSFDPTALLIFGGGGHGKSVIELVRAVGSYQVVGIIDDGMPVGRDIYGVPVLGGAKDLVEWYKRGVHLAVNAVGGIGNVAVRLKIFDILSNSGFVCPTIVHPTAWVEQSAVLEAGVQVLAQAYVGSSVRIGFGSLINLGAIIAHDCVLGKVVNLSPGATLAGNVRVEDHAQIGMRATVNLQITVGMGAMLGNGCTVKADVPAGARVRAGTIWPVPVTRP